MGNYIKSSRFLALFLASQFTMIKRIITNKSPCIRIEDKECVQEWMRDFAYQYSEKAEFIEYFCENYCILYLKFAVYDELYDVQ